MPFFPIFTFLSFFIGLEPQSEPPTFFNPLICPNEFKTNVEPQFVPYELDAEKIANLNPGEVVLFDTFYPHIQGNSRVEFNLKNGFVFDHHGPYFDYLAKVHKPYVNTTMLLIDYLKFQAKNKVSIACLKHHFKFVTTDNLGDGLWSIWISTHLNEVYQNNDLLNLIAAATYYEDFVAFGLDWEDGKGELNHTYTYDKNTGKTININPIALQQSLYLRYDEALKAHKLGGNGNDRFCSKFNPVSLTGAQQIKLISPLLAQITDYLKNGSTVLKNDSTFFKQSVLTLAENESAIAEKLHPSRKDIYIFERLQSNNTVFANWIAPYAKFKKNLAEKAKITNPPEETIAYNQKFLGLSKVNGNENQNTFVLAYHFVEKPDKADTSTREDLLKTYKPKIVAECELSNNEECKASLGGLNGRAELLYHFGGIGLSQEQIIGAVLGE